MTNEERIKARIDRDKEKRAAKKREFLEPYDDFDKVISYQNYYDALTKCQKGVMWKGTVQKYSQNCIMKIDNTIESIKNGVLPDLQNTKKIVIMERGKERIITPIKIEDRMTQRVVCDNALVPVISRTLIYDNGASMKDKGVNFAREEIMKHLVEARREYGNEFYILTFDFKSFFDSITHKSCLDVLNKHFTDSRLIQLCMDIIHSYQEQDLHYMPKSEDRKIAIDKIRDNQGVGICLGSQISQVMALAVPSGIDHYIKDTMSVRHYIRYMDDGIIMSNDKEFLHSLYAEMKVLASELGLRFNDKKTHIVKSTKGFVFLKIRYFISKEGRIIKKLTRAGVTRQRRKLYKFRKKVDNGEMSLDDVYNSMQSWLSHAKYVNAFHTVKSMMKLYNKLFDGYRMPSKNTKKEDKSNEVLRDDKWSDFRWDRN